MGFGSYDESEQETPSDDTDENVESVSVHEHDHDGEMSVESGASTDALVDQLAEMKSDE